MKLKDVLKKLEQDGWYKIRMRGSHRILAHSQKPGIREFGIRNSEFGIKEFSTRE